MLLSPVIGLTLLTACTRPAGHEARPDGHTPRPSVPVQHLGQGQRALAAHPVHPDLRVGAIFPNGGSLHVCTGSVLHSAAGNLVITAAHCLAGASRITFVPGLAGAGAPTDLWIAEAVYLDPRWIASRDPHADYAIARVGSNAGGSVESHVGESLTLGTAPALGSKVTVTGYPAGVGGSPIGCSAPTSVNDRGFPAVACDGLVGGTSGAPWVNDTTLTGLTGGFEHGGCSPNVSYSPPFDEQVARLLARAEAGGPGDIVPNDVGGTCS